MVLPSFLVTPAGLAALEAPEIDATFSAGEGLGAAVERVADARGAGRRRCDRLLPHRRAAGGERAPSRRCSPSPPPTAASSSAACAPPARSSCRRTRPGTPTWSRRSSATAQTSSARGSRSRRSPGWPRPTRSAATGPPRRGAGAAAALARGRRPEGDVEDGDLGRRELQRRAPVRGRGPRPAPLQAVLRRHRLGDRRIGLDGLERDALGRLAAVAEKPQIENPGFYKFRKGGEPRDRPRRRGLAAGERHRRARAGEGGEGRAPGPLRAVRRARQRRSSLEPRDLLELVPAAEPLPLDQVEAVDSIVRRFSGGAMSHGALRGGARDDRVALNRLGGRSNSGEGGEDPSRYRDERNSKIKQVASAASASRPSTRRFAESPDQDRRGRSPGEEGRFPPTR